ncbi:MAG: imidazole glycerol phosphate synthase subunit HisH [Ferruginibacter sp.]|nr:imidazole glycerol phosphate synthase subunit HisH [Ferruginibacter sp.]
MSKKVVIIDYQLGNLFSVQQACTFLGYPAIISTQAKDIQEADYAILPGVGAFADAMSNLKTFGLDTAIKEYVATGKPFMGICLGQQLMLTKSEEFEDAYGLGFIEGSVKKFPVQHINEQDYKVPQIQWNTIAQPANANWASSPLANCKTGDYFYFVHSYYTDVQNPAAVLATTKYGNLEYCSAIQHNNIFTTQFHPEKSGEFGLEIYKNWFNQNK